MELKRCFAADIRYVKDAIDQVKAEEDQAQSCEEAVIHFLENAQNYFIAAIDNEIVTGYAIAYCQNRLDTERNMLCLYEIGVLKNYRRQGIGSALIEYLKQISMEENILKMWVPTNVSNRAACALYKKTGGIASLGNDEIVFTYKFKQK